MKDILKTDERTESAGETEKVTGVSFGWAVLFTVSVVGLLAYLYWTYTSLGFWAGVRCLTYILGWLVADRIDKMYPALGKRRHVHNPLLYFRALLLLFLFNAFGISLEHGWLGIFCSAVFIVLFVALAVLSALYEEEREKLKGKPTE